MEKAGWGSVVLASIIGIAACSEPNPVVCCLSPSDCNSLGVMDQSRPCTDGFVCLNHECSTAPPVDAAPACTMDVDCPATASHCSSANTCVECVTSSQCPIERPVCDEANSCRTCTADSDCDSDSCNLESGTCRTSDQVLYASPTGVAAGGCERSSACSLTFAIQSATTTRYVVRMLPGSYATPLSISGKTVLIDGAGSTLNVGTSGEGIGVLDGASVQLLGLSITYLPAGSGTAIGCRASGATTQTLALSGVHLNSATESILANPCNVTITDSTFKQSNATSYAYVSLGASITNIARSTFDGGGGIRSYNAGSSITIVNSVIANMIDPTEGSLLGTNFGSGGAGSLSVSFSTLVNSPLRCGTGVPACQHGGVAGLCIDNSIIYGATGDQVTGSACATSYSIVTPESVAPPGNNRTNIDPLFVDLANKNYALTASSPAIDTANPSATPPATDILGTARPQGVRSDVGAFEYKP